MTYVKTRGSGVLREPTSIENPKIGEAPTKSAPMDGFASSRSLSFVLQVFFLHHSDFFIFFLGLGFLLEKMKLEKKELSLIFNFDFREVGTKLSFYI